MKLYIATPSYDGRVHAQYALSLADTSRHLAENKIAHKVEVIASGALLVQNRNLLVDQFMQSDCTHMLMIDSDLGWEPESVERMLKSGCDVIAGVYPSQHKLGFQFIPETDSFGNIALDTVKLTLRAKYVPAGFLMVSRAAFEKMQSVHTGLFYYKAPDHKVFAFFDTAIKDERFVGEDYLFSERVREAGLEIHVDPTIGFDHAGVKGRLIDAFKMD